MSTTAPRAAAQAQRPHLHQHSGFARVTRGCVIEQRPHASRRPGVPGHTRRALLLDVLLAIAIGTVLALVLFIGLSGGFRP